MDLTLNNDDSLPLFIDNITDAYNLSSDAFVSSPYANLSRQPTPFFRAPIVESMVTTRNNIIQSVFCV